VEYVIKTYEVSPDTDPVFVENGWLYTLTYRGELLPTPEPEPEPVAEVQPLPYGTLTAVLFTALALGGGVFGARHVHKKRRKP